MISPRRTATLFRKQKVAPPTFPIDYPSGVCVRSGDNVYYVNGKYIHSVKGARILASWNFPRIINSSNEALAGYVKAKRLGFRDGTLVRCLYDGKVYFISKGLRRQVSNPDLLCWIGLSVNDAVWVSLDEINLHKDGEVLK